MADATSTLELAHDLAPALRLLLRAHHLATDADESPWTFAVEIDLLRGSGASTCDLRWLVCKGFADHASETTRVGRKCRRFGTPGGLSFTQRTCFVLTDKGQAIARSVATGAAPNRVNVRASKAAKPAWNPLLRELWVNGELVKRFRVPASNQELILSAFQEEGWPRRLDDPLPPAEDVNPKRRLHAAIQRLNRNQKAKRIHFGGNGNSNAIFWELVDGA